MRKLTFLVVCAGFLFAACNSKNEGPINGGSIDVGTLTPEEIFALPYGSLTPEQQRVKLEEDGSKLVDLGDAASKSTVIEAGESLSNLLEIASIETSKKSKIASVEDIFEYADIFGIYTWNDTKQNWTKQTSTSELKFIFPSKKGSKTNNAVLTATIQGTGKYVVNEYDDYKYLGWNEINGPMYDTIHMIEKVELPGSGSGILTIDNKEAGKISFTPTYGANEVPTKLDFSLNLDGYVLTSNFEKAVTNIAKSKLSYKETTMFEAVAKTDIKMDEIMNNFNNGADDGEYLDLLKSATAYINIMDNLSAVFNANLSDFAKELDRVSTKEDNAFDKLDSETDLLWNTSNWASVYYKKYDSIQTVIASERNTLYQKLKAGLISRGDGTKIADIVTKTELITKNHHWIFKGGNWDWSNSPQGQYKQYKDVVYFKFGDNVEVEAEAYLNGFTSFKNKWESFVKSFERN